MPSPEEARDEAKRQAMERSLDYMGLEAGTPIREIAVDKVFIGSCTNGRIEDLREVAKVAEGRRVAEGVHAMIVPGSGLVKNQAEEEGLDRIFVEAGFDWREPGCSMCLAMNADRLQPGERCASTSNRNFEGRQGRGGRTHLMSPGHGRGGGHRRPPGRRAGAVTEFGCVRAGGKTGEAQDGMPRPQCLKRYLPMFARTAI